eukprot:tig00000754_g3905.t1
MAARPPKSAGASRTVDALLNQAQKMAGPAVAPKPAAAPAAAPAPAAGMGLAFGVMGRATSSKTGTVVPGSSQQSQSPPSSRPLDSPTFGHSTGHEEFPQGRVNFDQSVEVHERPEPPPDAVGHVEDFMRVDVQEILAPLFERVKAGQTEEEVVQTMREWMQEHLKHLPEETRMVVATHLSDMFQATQSELSKATTTEQERFNHLFGDVKLSIEEEIEVLQKKAKGGSFKSQMKHFQERHDALQQQQFEMEIAALQSRVQELETRLENQDNMYKAELRRLQGTQGGAAGAGSAEFLQEREQLFRDSEKWRQVAAEQEKRMKQLMTENEQLTRIVVEMRQHQAAQQRAREAQGLPPGVSVSQSISAPSASAILGAGKTDAVKRAEQILAANANRMQGTDEDRTRLSSRGGAGSGSDLSKLSPRPISPRPTSPGPR